MTHLSVIVLVNMMLDCHQHYYEGTITNQFTFFKTLKDFKGLTDMNYYKTLKKTIPVLMKTKA